MNRIYGTDGNVYETSISNGKEYTSSKKEKEEFAISELEYLKADIRFHGFYDERIEDLIDNHISELSRDNKQSKCNSCQNNTDELSGECYECVKGIEDWYEPMSELKGENK